MEPGTAGILGAARDRLPTREQEFGEGATLGVAPELSDPVGPLEVGKHQDVEEFGSSRRREGFEASSEAAFEFVGTHCPRLRPRTAYCVPV
jgi:hypothetical protein